MICDEEQMRFAKLLFATAQGMIKRVDGSEFQVAKRTIVATKLQEDDRLVAVKVVNEIRMLSFRQERIFLKIFICGCSLKKKRRQSVSEEFRLQKKDEWKKFIFLKKEQRRKITYGEKTVSLNRLKLAKKDGTGTKSR